MNTPTPLSHIHVLRGIKPSMAKKIPAGAGRVRGKSMTTPEVFSANSSMQSGPADQLYRTLLQVEVAGQDYLNIVPVGVLSHWAVQLDDPTKLITTAILSVSKDELRVVLGSHRFTLRLRS